MKSKKDDLTDSLKKVLDGLIDFEGKVERNKEAIEKIAANRKEIAAAVKEMVSEQDFILLVHGRHTNRVLSIQNIPSEASVKLMKLIIHQKNVSEEEFYSED